MLVFLPISAIVYYWIGARRARAAVWWLVAVSIVFYLYWEPWNILVLGASLLFNFAVAHLIDRQEPEIRRRYALWFGILGNLALLGWFKYANFIAGSLGAVAGREWSLGDIILPLGISFFTFTQVGYLVDIYRREAGPSRFAEYALFVTYFPHLISGPLLHHAEMIPQFRDLPRRPDWHLVAMGVTIFAIGLFKKAIVADTVALHAALPFDAAAEGVGVTMLEAGTGVLAYTLQLYFDFSGYCDMAIGVSLMLGIALPINFDSPYKAASIAEFWRRWHMTLGRFLTRYLYVPLGGNRVAPSRWYLNLMIVMVLSGLWHGAGWTFVVWGALHGLFLVVFQAWNRLRPRLGLGAERTAAGHAFGVCLTFVSVAVAWVFFRAHSLPEAVIVLEGLVGLHGIALPPAAEAMLGPLAPVLEAAGVEFMRLSPNFQPDSPALVLVLLAGVFVLPNSQQIVGYAGTALQRPPDAPARWARRLLWTPGPGWAAVSAGLVLVAVSFAQRNSEFLYFQF